MMFGRVNIYSAGQKIPCFYETRKFITEFTQADRLSLSFIQKLVFQHVGSKYFKKR